MKRYLTAGLLALAPLSCVFAAPVSMDPAWLDLEHKLTALVGQANQRQILDMAYAEVTTDACTGFKVDSKAFQEGVESIRAEARKKYPEEEMKSVEQKAATYYGVYLGFLISDSYADRDTFCKQAADVRTKKAGPSRFWTAQTESR